MRTHLLPLLALALLVGCPSEDDTPVDPTIIYIEESDEDNDTIADAEVVDEQWTSRLLIQGNARECDYDNDVPANEWEYVGDKDFYEIVIPERGYVDVKVSWEMDADIDLLQLFIEDNGASISIDFGETATTNDTGAGDEEFFIEDEFNSDDELYLLVACAQGDDGDYELELLWEE